MADETYNEFSGMAENVVQARDVYGGIHVHQSGDQLVRIQGLSELVNRIAPAGLVTRMPYPGLEAFTEDDASFFFGRGDDIATLLDRLQPITQPRKAHRFVAVLGPSGIGKSSLVRAGLIPRLLGQRNPWLIVPPLVPENQPIRNLADSLAALLPDQRTEMLATSLARGSAELVRACNDLRAAKSGRSAPVLVVVDQAEELLTLCDEQERIIFLELLRGALDADSRFWVVVTLRSEFLTDFLYTDFVDFFRDPVVVGRLARSNLGKVIEGPASIVELKFSPGLVPRLVDDTGGGDALPLLAYTLQALYLRARADGMVTEDLYDQLGGVAGALSRQADRIVTELDAIVPNAPVIATLLKTVTLDEGGATPVRRRIRRSSLSDAEQVVADVLIAARLLTSDTDGVEPTIQVAHEALFRQWPPLQQAIAARIDDLRQRADVERWAHDWARSGHRDSYLLQGERLIAVQQWIATHGDFLEGSPLLISFLERSARADHAAADRLSEAIALQALAGVDRDPENSVLYALLALEECSVTPLAERALLTGLSACHATSVLHGHRDTIGWVAWSPDGTRLATASRDHTVRIWDAHTGTELRVLLGHTGSVDSVAWSPDSALLATTSRDGTIRTWDAASGRELRMLRGHEDNSSAAAWSPDGSRLAASSRDRTARVWDARTGAQISVLRGHENWVEGVAFSPDGTRLATASEDGTARIWDSSTGRELRILRGHEDWVGWVAWSPDGSRLATGSRDRTARVWDARTGAQISVLRGHENWVEGVAFSPDGTRLATASEDGTVRVWTTETSDELVVLRGHQAWVRGVAWSPDNARIATASGDHTVRLWEVVAGAGCQVLPGAGSTEGVAWAPDGSRLATVSQDQTCRIWDARTGVELRAMYGHDSLVKSVAWAPDGSRLATVSRDQTCRIWDARIGVELRAMRGHRNWLWDVTWSPDGSQLATGSADGTARVWDTRTGTEVLVLNHDDGGVHGVAWSPDGTMLATGSTDRTARTWDMRTGTELRVLRGHESWVEGVAWSPNSAYLATVSGDHTVRVWDVRSGAETQILDDHDAWVDAVAWSPDGTRIASAARDRTVRIWEIYKERAEGRIVGVHGGWVRSVSWSPDGTRLATASSDGTTQTWNATIDLEALITKARARTFHQLTNEARQRLLLLNSTVSRWHR